MATGDNLTSAKAVYAAIIGFLAPGAAYLVGVQDGGFTGTEWIVALLFCVGGGAIAGVGTYAVENKPKTP